MLTTFRPPPGIIHDGTDYSSKGSWYDCDKMRFRGGFPEKIGGWAKLTTVGSTGSFVGICRLLFEWVDLSGVLHTAIFTNKKVYTEDSGGVLTDRTPLRPSTLPANPVATTNGDDTVTMTHTAHGLSTGDRVLVAGASATGGFTTGQLNAVHTITVATANTYTFDISGATASSTATGGGSAVTVLYSRDFNVPLPANPFATTNGLSTVTVTHTSHGCAVGDYVTLIKSGGLTLNNLAIIDATAGESEYVVASVPTANTYTITVSGTANATGSGGGTCYAEYQLAVGQESYTSASGFGSGGFGSGGFGIGGSSAYTTGTQPRVWSADNFGQMLIFNPRGGAIYYYDPTLNLRPIDLRLVAGADEAPSQASYIMVSDEDRRLFAFGVTDPSTLIFDPMLVRWSDPEAAWNMSAGRDTTAGQLRLSTGSGIRCARKARGEILVWTESALVTIRFADEFVYGQNLVSPNTDIIGQNTVVSIDDSVVWIGQENFFFYDGRVQTLPCDVRQYVFSDINLTQAYKVCVGTNRQHREVWWFYPSASSSENDRYVVFNYAEKKWYYGTMNRTAWSDSKDRENPIGASTDGYVYLHEYGLDDGETGLGVSAYIESSPIELDDGDHFLFLRRVIPDITFDESSTSGPSVTYTLRPRNWPGAAYGTSQTGTTTQTVSGTVEQWTKKLDVRLRGRHFVLKVSSSGAGVKWRLGNQRFDVRPDGKK